MEEFFCEVVRHKTPLATRDSVFEVRGAIAVNLRKNHN